MKRCTFPIFFVWVVIFTYCSQAQCKEQHQSARQGNEGSSRESAKQSLSSSETFKKSQSSEYQKMDKPRKVISKLAKFRETSIENQKRLKPLKVISQAKYDDRESSIEYFKQKSSKENLVNVEMKEKDDCWVGLNAKWLFHNMAKLDAKYADVRRDYQQAADNNHFDQALLEEILKDQGEAQRAIHRSLFKRRRIPRGMNLGGRCMIRLPDSVLFFHRMKVKEQTIFRIDYLHSDLENMTLQVRLSLHDLQLGGSYERALTDQDPSNLFYRPTYSELSLLLKNVRYKMEGRYRLLKDQLVVELVLSDIMVSEVLMMYKPNTTCTEQVEKLEIANVDKLLAVVRTDLDLWLKDYFNDYLRYYGLAEVKATKEFQQYDLQKAGTLNRFLDQGIETLKNRMRQLRITNWKVPGFSVFAVNGMQIRLKNGVLRGLDTLHRRSVATGRIENNIRYVDAVVGFGKLRLVYEYDALLSTGSPPVTGMFVLASDQLTAKFSLSLVKEPETAELSVSFYQQLSEETLTVEGPINRMIANFKHILENHIMTLMYNILVHHIKLLGRLTKCDPNLPGHNDDGRREDVDSSISREREKIVLDESHPDTNAGIIPCIPETDLKKALIGIARVDSLEFEVPSDVEEGTHRRQMHLKYNERIAIEEMSTTTTTTEETTTTSAEEKTTSGEETTPSNADNTTTTGTTSKDEFDIRLSREDTVEIDYPDGKGGFVPKKIKYWEGAALGKNPKGPKVRP